MVHQVLVDPVPEARATAAKALGTLVERLGEVHFPDLVPGLLRILKTDTSGVDRQGAAQGLSEVLSGLGMERLEGLLPDIIANAQSPRPTVREGFMSLLVFLPSTFGTRFQPHLPKIITPILGGLSDTEEYVRDAAMRAGRMVVTNYSNKAIDLLLPELERGMFDPGWRIRVSADFHQRSSNLTKPTLSNLRLLLLESYYSKCLAYPGKFLILKRRKWLWRQTMLNLLVVLFLRFSGRSVVIASSQRYILSDKTELLSFASHPFRSGRFLYIIPLAQVCHVCQ